jgi:dolichol-phosphate mannosyltransferase
MKAMKKTISVVSPVFNEEGNIKVFYNELKKVLNTLDYDHEIIFINDGSSDNSLVYLVEITLLDDKVKILNLSRNFGHQLAITAGIDHAKGDCVIILDSDMQDPPSVIIGLITKWEDGFQVVNAKRKSRQDGFFKNFTAKFFYKFLNSILSNKIPENVGDYRLLDKKAVLILQNIKEKDRYLRGLSTWIGFKQTEVLFDRDKRFSGKTHYPLSKMLGLGMNAIFSFSRVPMKLATFFSTFFLVLSLLIIIYVIISLFLGHTVAGWASTLLIFAIFSGIQMMVLAIISEYVGRIYTQVQNRPLYIVDEIIEKK